MSNRITRAVSPYFSQTKSLKYSYLSVLPLLILYEVLILVSQPESGSIVRLTTDIWFKNIFATLGLDTFGFTFILAGILGVVIYFVERDKPVTLRLRFFGYMILESTIYAIILAFIISGGVGFLFNAASSTGISSLTTLQKLALSLGAGLYEELVFRVLLVGALLYVFKWFGLKKGSTQILAMVVAALLFSAVHYMGSMGDAFTFSSFTFRFLFGLALNGVLIYRGFGIAAWTHSMYDVLVVLGT